MVGFSNEDASSHATYTNHYNSKLNKCFVLLTVTGFPENKSHPVKSLELAKPKPFGTSMK